MKKTGFIVYIALVLMLSISASVWEGSAASAVAGDLPEKGFYAATNSFPRNTIVDVTNLENGKTVRVIVSGGIENPGLLAVLSRDAAESIGLESKSVGRVRMSQPADPVAFSRFSEGKASSGDPDYDPKAFANANVLKEDEPLPPVTLDDEPKTKPASPAAPEVFSGWEETVVVEEEPGGFEEDTIVEIPDDYTPPPAPVKNSEGIAAEPVPDAAPDAAVTSPGQEKSPAASAPATPAPVPAVTEAAPAEAAPPGGEPSSYEYSLVPAEARPPAPVDQVTPDPGAIIAANTNPALTGTPAPIAPAPAPAPAPLPEKAPASPEPVVVVVPSFALIEALPAMEQPVPKEQPVPQPAAPKSAASEPAEKSIDPSMVIAEVPPAEVPPAKAPPPPAVPPAAQESFSVPVIDRLQKGQYYLQIAALTNSEAVETELAKIGNTWPLAVQLTGSPAKPLYRILLGPLNRGESGALLKRFKGSGYTDAFVRSN